MTNTGFVRHVYKPQSTCFRQEIFKQTVPRLPSARWLSYKLSVLVEPRPLYEIDVQITVVIVIEKGNSRTHDLGHVVLACCPAEVMEIESGFSGHLAKQARFITAGVRQAYAAAAEPQPQARAKSCVGKNRSLIALEHL